eukprot:365399-Chlamydomonas_euryale.AAC.19
MASRKEKGLGGRGWGRGGDISSLAPPARDGNAHVAALPSCLWFFPPLGRHPSHAAADSCPTRPTVPCPRGQPAVRLGRGGAPACAAQPRQAAPIEQPAGNAVVPRRWGGWRRT